MNPNLTIIKFLKEQEKRLRAEQNFCKKHAQWGWVAHFEVLIDWCQTQSDRLGGEL